MLIFINIFVSENVVKHIKDKFIQVKENFYIAKS